MATLEQKLALLEDRASKLRKQIKNQDTSQKVVLGGALLAYARKNQHNADRALHILAEFLRSQDESRVAGVIDELQELAGNRVKYADIRKDYLEKAAAAKAEQERLAAAAKAEKERLAAEKKAGQFVQKAV